MNDLLVLLWKLGDQKYYTVHDIDYMCNDAASLLNGFDSVASNKVSKEESLLLYDSLVSDSGQYNLQSLYTTPVKDKYEVLPTRNLVIESEYVNAYTNEGDAYRPALQVLADFFSGYIIKLDKINTPITTGVGSTKLTINGFRVYTDSGGSYVVRGSYNFAKGTSEWDYRTNGIMQIVLANGTTNYYAKALTHLDKYSGLIINKIDSCTGTSTVKTFNDYLNHLISVTKGKQITNGRVTNEVNSDSPNYKLTKSNYKVVFGEDSVMEY